jgi:hypothetical protein
MIQLDIKNWYKADKEIVSSRDFTKRSKEEIFVEYLADLYDQTSTEDFHINETPIALCREILDKLIAEPEVNRPGKKWLVIANLEFLWCVIELFKSRNWSFDNIWFASAHKKKNDVASSLLRNGNVVQYLYESIKSWDPGMKFDVIVGNPPYSAKTKIHLKIIQKVECLLKHDAFLAFVIPKKIFDRSLDENKKFTSWLELTSLLWYKDCLTEFSNVSEIISVFLIKNNKIANFKNLKSTKKFKTFKAKPIIGLDYYKTTKIQNEIFNIPLIECIDQLGNPSFKRFTNEENLLKIRSKAFSKPVIFVNFKGSMAARENIAFLERNCQNGWLRQYVKAFVFETIDEAEVAFDYLKSDEFKEFVKEHLETSWDLNSALMKIFNN